MTIFNVAGISALVLCVYVYNLVLCIDPLSLYYSPAPL